MSKNPFLLKNFADPDGFEHQSFVEDLAKSGLAPADVPHWFAVREKGIAHTVGSDSIKQPGGGYAIPYRTLDGEPVIDDAMPAPHHFVRFKLMSPFEVEREDGTIKTGAKYLSPVGTSAHIYIPERTALILRSTDRRGEGVPLIITEGEKKAEAVVKATEFPCVALAGVNMSSAPTADKRTVESKRQLHPELVEVIAAYRAWAGENAAVLVIFDSDGCPMPAKYREPGMKEVRTPRKKTGFVHNVHVFSAGVSLADRLYNANKRAIAASAEFCPPKIDSDAKGAHFTKQGLDDWILSAGPAAVSEQIARWANAPALRITNPLNLDTYELTHNLSSDIRHMVGLLSENADFYVYGNNPALIKPGAKALHVLSNEGMLGTVLSSTVQIFEPDREGVHRPVYVPQRLCTTLLAYDWDNVDSVRKVRALAQQPVPMLLPGHVPYVSKPGYDETCQLYSAYDGEEWSLNPTTPEEYYEAARLVSDLLREIYLETPADLAAMLAAMFTAVARQGLPVAPGFVLSAPNSGAGKSYVANILSLLASEEEPDTLTLETRGANGNADFSKMVLGVLETSRPVMLFDEVDDRKIDAPSLRKLISAEVFSGRRLGSNTVLTLPTRKLVLITANNVDPTQDSARRFAIIRIKPPADPAMRRQNLTRGAVELLKENRQKYVQATLTLLLFCLKNLAVLEQNQYMPPGLTILPGFTAWSQTCAAPAVLASWMILKDLDQRGELETMNLIEKDALEGILKKNPTKEPIEELSPLWRQKDTQQNDPSRAALRDLLRALFCYQKNKASAKAPNLQSEGRQGFTTDLLIDELRSQKQNYDRYVRSVASNVEKGSFNLLLELREGGLRDDQLANTRSLGQILGVHRDREVLDEYYGTLQLVQLRRVSNTNVTVWHVKAGRDPEPGVKVPGCDDLQDTEDASTDTNGATAG